MDRRLDRYVALELMSSILTYAPIEQGLLLAAE